jgi:hypothetical protein
VVLRVTAVRSLMRGRRSDLLVERILVIATPKFRQSPAGALTHPGRRAIWLESLPSGISF